MNIFALSNDPCIAAVYAVDSHVRKMPTESAQMLSTIWQRDPYPPEVAYKATHLHHPCTVWAGVTTGNYRWLFDHAVALVHEKSYRWPERRLHAVARVLVALREPPACVPVGPLLPFAQCMPEPYRQADPVAAYRFFYTHGKRHLHAWTRREAPWWLNLYADCKPATLAGQQPNIPATQNALAA